MKVVVLLFLGFVVGGWLGSKISLGISDTALKKIFAVVLLILAVKILFFDEKSLS